MLNMFKKQIRKDVVNHYDRSEDLLQKMFASKDEDEKMRLYLMYQSQLYVDQQQEKVHKCSNSLAKSLIRGKAKQNSGGVWHWGEEEDSTPSKVVESRIDDLYQDEEVKRYKERNV